MALAPWENSHGASCCRICPSHDFGVFPDGVGLAIHMGVPCSGTESEAMSLTPCT